MTNAAFGIRESASYRELKLTFLFFANLDTDSVWIVYLSNSKVSIFFNKLKKSYIKSKCLSFYLSSDTDVAK